MRLLKSLLNALIVLFVVLMITIIWTGGYEVRIFVVEISCRSLVNPIIFFSISTLFRFFLMIGRVNSIVFSMALFVSAGLAEGFLRVVDLPLAQPILKEIMQPSSVLGYQHVPLLSDRSIKINSHGLRDREFGWEKPEGVKRLLGIGDSFTFGYGVNLDNCYLKQLERQLNQNGDKWEVINAGVTGYTMWQYLAYFEHYGYRYEPDLVTIGLFFDDFYGAPSGAQKKSDFQRYRPFKSIRLVNLSRNCLELLKYRYRYLLGAGWLKTVEERRNYILNFEYAPLLRGKAESELYGNFEFRLEKFKRIAEEHNARLLVVFIPDIVQLKHPELQVVNAIVEQIALKCHVDFLDITPHFEEVKDFERLYLLPYDAHTSRSGHGIIAREIENKIKAGLISRNHVESKCIKSSMIS